MPARPKQWVREFGTAWSIIAETVKTMVFVRSRSKHFNEA